jgi:hypothetical protein
MEIVMRSFRNFLAERVLQEGLSPEQKAIKKQILEKFADVTDAEMLPLPYDHDIYFKMDDPKTMVLKLRDLSNIRARPEGIRNGLVMMYAASRGENMGLGKRVPISVIDKGEGKYEIFDGNSTFNIAKMSGWEDIPALLVDENGNYI